MEEKSNKLWYVILVLCLLILEGVAYVKIETVRTLVDDKCPFVKDMLAKYNVELPKLASATASAGATPEPSASPAASPAANNTASSKASPAGQTAAAPAATSKPGASKPGSSKGNLTIAQVLADQTLWPKKIALKKDTTFPAVMNKQKVGELHVAAGTEVLLIQVSNNKLGVAYTPNGSMENAGGAMVDPADTDLVERANAAKK